MKHRDQREVTKMDHELTSRSSVLTRALLAAGDVKPNRQWKGPAIRKLLASAVAFVPVALITGMPSSAQAASCDTICVSFVTSYDPDGSGPLRAVTARHDNIPVDVPYVLDTDGILPPLPLGTLPTVPGYELSAMVQAVDAAQPTILLEKLLTAPPTFPLRVELIRPVTDGWQSFGYDTLNSSAPTRFQTALDLRERDGNAATDDAAGRLTIAGPAASLTVVNERFGGDPAGTRTRRHVRRLTFSGDGKATHVPGTVTLDAHTSETMQHVVVTRDVATVLGVEVSEPGGSVTTATLDRMPARADLKLTAANTSRSQTLTIDYSASSPTTNASVTTVSGGRTTKATVTGLPAIAHLTYNDAKGVYEDPFHLFPTDITTVTYSGSSVVPIANFSTAAGKRSLRVHLEGVPTKVNDLSGRTRTVKDLSGVHEAGTSVHLLATGRLKQAEVELRDGARHVLTTARNVPTEFTGSLTKVGGTGLHYQAAQPAGGAHLVADDDQGQHFDVDATTIPKTLDLQLTNRAQPEEGFDLAYTADGSVTHLVADGTGLKNLPGGANHAHLDLTGLPQDLRIGSGQKTTVTTGSRPIPPPPARKCESEHPPPGCEEVRYDTYTTTTKDLELYVTTPVGRLGSGDLLVTSGPEDRLPATSITYNKPQDGLLMRDLPDRWVLSGHVQDFEQATINRSATVSTHTLKPSDRETHSETHAVLETLHNNGRALTLDMRQGPESERRETLGQLGGEPGRIVLDLSDNSTFESATAHLHADWPIAPVPVGTHTERAVQFHETVQRDGQQPWTITSFSLATLPMTLDVCRLGTAPNCANSVFDTHITDLAQGHNVNYSCFLDGCATSQGIPVDPAKARFGSLRIDSDIPTDFAYTAHPDRPSSAETSVDLTGLRHFALQADQRYRSCWEGTRDCMTAYVGLDTSNQRLQGTLRSVTPEGSSTEFRFAPGFSAGARVMAVDQIWDYGGRAAVQADDISCPGDTSMKTSIRDITDLVCDGTVLPFKLLW